MMKHAKTQENMAHSQDKKKSTGNRRKPTLLLFLLSFHFYYHTHNPPDTKCVGFFPPYHTLLQHMLSILQVNSILTIVNCGSLGYPQLHSDLTTNWRLPWPLPWIRLLAIVAQRTQGDTFTSLLKDVIKDTDEQPGEEIYRVGSGRISSTGVVWVCAYSLLISFCPGNEPYFLVSLHASSFFTKK